MKEWGNGWVDEWMNARAHEWESWLPRVRPALLA